MIFSSAEDMANYLSRFGESNQIFKGDHQIQYRFKDGTLEKRLSPYKDKPSSYKYSISKSGGIFYFKTESDVIAGDDEYVIKLFKNQANLADALGVAWKPPVRSMVWMAFYSKSDPDAKAFVLCV